MRASFLLCLAFCLSVSAVWRVDEYTEYYRDSYDYDCSGDLAYVELEEVESCTPYEYCYSSSYLMYTTSCVNTTDLDSYFDDYYMIIEYDTQCDSEPVAYYLYSDACLEYYDSYYYTDNYAMWFECYQPLSDVTLYYAYDGTTTCDAGYYSYTNYGPSVYTSYKLGDCFGYSTYYQVLCNVSAVPGWQVIKYTATESDVSDGDCSEDVLYVEYYATAYCQPLGCVEGEDFYENWSCQEDEPEPADFFTNPVVLYNFNDGSYDCFGYVYSHTVLNPGCAEGDEYYWFFDVDRDEGDIYLRYSNDENCTTYYSYFYGRDFYIAGSEEIHYGCVDNDGAYTLIADDTATPGYQVVKYYAGPSTDATLINVDMWYTEACIEQTILQEYDSYGGYYLTEEWYCEDEDEELDPFEFIEDGYLIAYHADDDGACAGEPVEYQVYNTECTADADGTHFWTYECTSTHDDTSLDLVRCDDAACTTGCYTYEYIVGTTTIGDTYCSSEGKSEGAGSYYLELHCSPPSPGYQIMSVHTDLAVKPVRAVVSWNEYCTEYYGGYDGILHYVYNCSFGDEDDELDWTEYFDAVPITIDYYYSDTCDEDYYLYTMAIDVGCINTPASSTGLLAGTSVWAYCDPDNGYMTQYLCEYDVVPDWEECIDYETFPYYGTSCYSESEYPYYYYSSDEDGCFFNYDSSSYYYYNYYTIDCGDIVTNSVYWVDSYSTTEASCLEEPDLLSFGYFTRFCGAEETCELGDDTEVAEVYYVNKTCIEQDEIEGYLIGGVIAYDYDSDECDDDNYLEGYTFYYNGCYLDEESGKYSLFECDHAEDEYKGLVNIGTDCTSCDITTCADSYEAEDGECQDGTKFVCGSSAVSVAGLFVAILALLAFAL